MTLANDAIQYALDEYDRADLRSFLATRLQRALFELHGLALFAEDLVVSPTTSVVSSPVTIVKPSNFRHLDKVLAYDATGALIADNFTEARVVAPKDYFGCAIPRSYQNSGLSIIASYTDIAPTTMAISYYKFPTCTVTDGVPDTDSWIVAKDYTILAAKLCAIVAKAGGKKDDVADYEKQAMLAMQALSGD